MPGGKTTGPPGPCVPHGGTPAAPPPLSVPPLGVTGSFQSRGLASSSSCCVPNCSRQESHELGGAPAEKLNGMIIIRMSENYFKLIFLASLFSAYLRRRYSLILSLFFSKYSCFCTHTIEGLSCFHCLAYSFILSLFAS